MSGPHSEVIISAVLDSLMGINKESGYFCSPKSVARYSRRGLDQAERPSITLWRENEGKSLPGQGAGEGSSWDAVLILKVVGLLSAQDPAFDEETDILIGQMQDDIEKALQRTGWPALQANVVRMESVSLFFDSNEPDDGVEVTATIRYAHAYGDSSLPLAPN